MLWQCGAHGIIDCGIFIDVEEDREPFTVGEKMRTGDW